NLVRSDMVVTRDRGKIRGIRSLHRGRAIPRIEHVLRAERVTVRKSHVLAQLERVGGAIGGHGGHAQRDVRNHVEVAVELQQGVEKVTGATRFTADLELAGLLHVQLVVSQAPSARIRGIETSAARSAPGVIDVITSRELPETDSAGPDVPLAKDRVFYLGQPVV